MENLGSVLLLMLTLTLKVPTLASDLLGGTASLSAGDGVGAGLVAGGAIGAVAGGAYVLGTGAANGVVGAIKAGQSAIAQARERGATGVMETTAGAADAIGGAAGEMAMNTVKGLGAKSVGGRLSNQIEARSASIREAKAAGSPAVSVPGSQPVAPSSPAGPARQALTADKEQTPPSDDLPLSIRDTPPAPTERSVDAGADARGTTPAYETSRPIAMQATSPSAMPTTALVSTPTTNNFKGSSGTVTGPAAPIRSSGGDSALGSIHTGSKPAASSKVADAAKQALIEVEKTGGTPGGSIQTHHGDE